MISATATSSEMPPVSVYIGYPVWGSLMVGWISYVINGSRIRLFLRFWVYLLIYQGALTSFYFFELFLKIVNKIFGCCTLYLYLPSHYPLSSLSHHYQPPSLTSLPPTFFMSSASLFLPPFLPSFQGLCRISQRPCVHDCNGHAVPRRRSPSHSFPSISSCSPSIQSSVGFSGLLIAHSPSVSLTLSLSVCMCACVHVCITEMSILGTQH